MRLPAWAVVALDKVVDEENAEGESNLNRSHLIRTAVTQFLAARGHTKPQKPKE